MKQIEAVIFDWAGTTVDYGCMAPIYAMQAAFSQHDVTVSLDEIRKPMGMLKIDHIKAVLAMDTIRNQFQKIHGRAHHLQDIEKIYHRFEESIFSILHQHTTLIDGILPVQVYLRQQNIKIGSTSGYTRAMLDIVARSAKEQGYAPDHMISSDEVWRGRPYPYMIQQNMTALEILDVNTVLKVGDTLIDIQEGCHAGCWSVGVVMGSSLLGLGEAEVISIDKSELNKKAKAARYEMFAAGADYVIDTMHELPALISVINQRMAG